MSLNYFLGGTKHSLDENLAYANINNKTHLWIELKDSLFCLIIILLIPVFGFLLVISMLFALIALPVYTIFRYFNFGQKTTL